MRAYCPKCKKEHYVVNGYTENGMIYGNCGKCLEPIKTKNNNGKEKRN